MSHHCAQGIYGSYKIGVPGRKFPEILQRLVGLGVDLHALDEEGGIPFRLLLNSSARHVDHRFFQSWPATLAKAGPDIEQCGAVGQFCLRKALDESHHYSVEREGLMGFAYGSNRFDWQLWY